MIMKQRPGSPYYFEIMMYEGRLPVKNDGTAGIVEFDEKKRPNWIPILQSMGFDIVADVEVAEPVEE